MLARIVNNRIVSVTYAEGQSHLIEDGWVPIDAAFRTERDMKLATEVDAIAGNALRWAALSAEQQNAWAVYRQALLDVPQQAGFPNEVTWPVKL